MRTLRTEVIKSIGKNKSLEIVEDSQTHKWGIVSCLGHQICPYIFDSIFWIDETYVQFQRGKTFSCLRYEHLYDYLPYDDVPYLCYLEKCSQEIIKDMSNLNIPIRDRYYDSNRFSLSSIQENDIIIFPPKCIILNQSKGTTILVKIKRLHDTKERVRQLSINVFWEYICLSENQKLGKQCDDIYQGGHVGRFIREQYAENRNMNEVLNKLSGKKIICTQSESCMTFDDYYDKSLKQRYYSFDFWDS